MPFKGDKRITIFTGHYGSGKTEIAINFTLQVNVKTRETVLVDLDFINPYFRSREARETLMEQGITVIASAEEYFNTDLPALSPMISGVLQNSQARVIIDLGGDEAGARAAGRFRNQIRDEEYELCFVVNPFRPFTTNPEDIGQVIQQIEKSSRLKVTSLISNSNLLRETSLENIINGHQTVLAAAKAMSLPVKFVAVESRFTETAPVKSLGLPVLALNRMMKTPWE